MSFMDGPYDKYVKMQVHGNKNDHSIFSPHYEMLLLVFCFDSVWGINIETETEPKTFSPTQTSQAMECVLVFQFEFVIWYKL
jgi:hypothetical protein